MKGAAAARERNRRALRASILAAAREALLRDGIEGLSMRRLAETIGYSPGTIYLHFKDKDELLYEVVEETFARLLEALTSGERTLRGPAELRRKMLAYVDFGLRHPEHYRFVFMTRPPTAPRARMAVPHEAFSVLRETVRDCIASGAFRQVDLETTSQGLWTTVHGITSLLIARPDFPWVERDTLVAQVVDTAIDGLCRKGADA